MTTTWSALASMLLIAALSIPIAHYLRRVAALAHLYSPRGASLGEPCGRYLVTWHGRAGGTPPSNRLLAALLVPLSMIVATVLAGAFYIQPAWDTLACLTASLYLVMLVLSETYGPAEFRVSKDGLFVDTLIPWSQINVHSWHQSPRGWNLTVRFRNDAYQKTVHFEFPRLSDEGRAAIEKAFGMTHMENLASKG